ncbi:hypothetical protein FHR84_002810 [Actinopolyspora biskrensis]|uniref:DUF3558 domain-containing protein n=1 Tax=Actinopolyspora biskrensis TaxID=1470178 RepID=A0A852Z0E7_9ACTN|nr:DUF3558 family protein [Actinopolyspora biskrensis]NYH79472.1 hypothetical protein [Actinopolyspora biskrensis]
MTILPLVSSCSSSEPQQTPSTTNNSASTKKILSSMSPCDTLTQKQKNTLGIENKGKTNETLGAESCEWRTREGSTNIVLHTDKSMEDLEVSNQETSSFSIGNRQGRVSLEETLGVCSVVIPVNDSESISVDAQGDGNATSCEVAKKVAPMVEKNIPEN